MSAATLSAARCRDCRGKLLARASQNGRCFACKAKQAARHKRKSAKVPVKGPSVKRTRDNVVSRTVESDRVPFRREVDGDARAPKPSKMGVNGKWAKSPSRMAAQKRKNGGMLRIGAFWLEADEESGLFFDPHPPPDSVRHVVRAKSPVPPRLKRRASRIEFDDALNGKLHPIVVATSIPIRNDRASAPLMKHSRVHREDASAQVKLIPEVCNVEVGIEEFPTGDAVRSVRDAQLAARPEVMSRAVQMFWKLQGFSSSSDSVTGEQGPVRRVQKRETQAPRKRFRHEEFGADNDDEKRAIHLSDNEDDRGFDGASDDPKDHDWFPESPSL